MPTVSCLPVSRPPVRPLRRQVPRAWRRRRRLTRQRSPNPRATHLASSAGGVAPVAKPSPIPAVRDQRRHNVAPARKRPARSATIDYDVGPENGDGVNVSIPLQRLDGLVLKPGDTFNFWKAVGEVSRRAGYKLGGIIVGDHLEPARRVGRRDLYRIERGLRCCGAVRVWRS